MFEVLGSLIQLRKANRISVLWIIVIKVRFHLLFFILTIHQTDPFRSTSETPKISSKQKYILYKNKIQLVIRIIQIFMIMKTLI